MERLLMNSTLGGFAIYIGWDVGGWNCDKNKSSRDALVVLDANRTLLGQPWRGNLCAAINQANTTAEWVQALLDCCQVAYSPDDLPSVILAIDTPLGFLQAFRQLINGEGAAGPIDAPHYRRAAACQPLDRGPPNWFFLPRKPSQKYDWEYFLNMIFALSFMNF